MATRSLVLALLAGLAALPCSASPFKEADECQPPGKRVWTRDNDGASTVRCVAPDQVEATKVTAVEPFTVVVTYGRALPRRYAECVTVEAEGTRQVSYRCAALAK